MTLQLGMPWRRAARANANAYPPATGDAGGGTPTTFPNAPSGGGWTAVSEGDPSGLPRRNEEGAYESANGTGMVVYEQDMYIGTGAYNYLTYTGGVSVPWAATGSYLSMRFPPNHPGGYAPVVVYPDPFGTGLLSIPSATAATGEVYYGFYIRFRGDGSNPYTSSGNQQKLVYHVSTDAGSDIAHIIIGDLPNLEDLSLVTQFNNIPGGSFNNIYRGVSDVLTDQAWHLVEYIIKRNTYTAGTGTVSVSGTTATFSTSQTGFLTEDTRVVLGTQTFNVVSGAGTSWVIDRTPASTVSGASFQKVNADGTFTLWLDGTQRATASNVILFEHSGGDNAVMDTLVLYPIYGGGTNPSPAWNLYVDYGRIKTMAR
jgi:hypothetical protein